MFFSGTAARAQLKNACIVRVVAPLAQRRTSGEATTLEPNVGALTAQKHPAACLVMPLMSLALRVLLNTGIYSGSNFLSVRCRCSERCAHETLPQLFGLEEWAQYHAKGVHLPELENQEEQEAENERLVQGCVMVLLDGTVDGQKVGVGWRSSNFALAAVLGWDGAEMVQ